MFVYVDINECIEKKDECDHNCHNTIGSYQCSCRDGYKIENNKRNCTGMSVCQNSIVTWK